VVGDSDFAANYSANIPGNTDMFLSVVRWLAQDNGVAIPSRSPETRVLTMTDGQRRLVSWFALLIVPGVALGVAVSLRKRV
jgi:ABC-type uncharacterized transport system involved in gliding motility auxiliary subunit